jgi:hypothetical protein
MVTLLSGTSMASMLSAFLDGPIEKSASTVGVKR